MIGPVPRWLAIAVCLFSALIADRVVADVAVPTLVTHVTDMTGTLSGQQKNALEEKLHELEQRKGSQLLILIVPSTGPEVIEQYATRVFDAWEIGREKVDDGVLLLWAKNDRRIRIEVGRGLEGAIPDALTNRIITETMRPLFRAEAWYEGLDKATDQLIGLIDGEALPVPPASIAQPSAPRADDFVERYFPVFFFVPIVVIVTSLWPRRREFSASLAGSGVAAAIACKVLDLPMHALPWIGLIYFLIGMAYAFNLVPGSGTIGRSSGGWNGGSGSSGGSWGGGGGSSAGGGASGSY